MIVDDDVVDHNDDDDGEETSAIVGSECDQFRSSREWGGNDHSDKQQTTQQLQRCDHRGVVNSSPDGEDTSHPSSCALHQVNRRELLSWC